ncbi:uncharacterized protein LOC106663889 isoform X2 [Cimex lectularius]|uniref:Thymidine phosphorylase n=1 Tax=Cimex lectularius TaxID=79782 RepID=A0A8I6SUL2_CIMLE|nr:uncharacterized protein LOC106663889 isoform X2 [Cimex lectularius]
MSKIVEILKKKRDGLELNNDDIVYYINSASNRIIDDCQIGHVMKWDGLTVDKHSTGGVGDKISLPLAPALSALGLKVPMMTGRGLELTGGTLDKLESIPGYNVELTEEEMKRSISECGCFMSSTTQNICPGDKVTYRIRDVTATVQCLGLVIGSILSKKLAEGTKYLIIDCKVGETAMFKTVEEAEKAAVEMKKVANELGLSMKCAVTEMSNPIGFNVGNSLEVIESVECLKGKGSEDLSQMVECLGGELLELCGMCSVKEGKEKIHEVLTNGEALKKFNQMMILQGVNKRVADEICYGDACKVIPTANHKTYFKAPETGWVKSINAKLIATVCWKLGSGRMKPTDPLDFAVGAEILKHVGFPVQKSENWIAIHHNKPITDELKKMIESALLVSDKIYQRQNRILKIF